MPITRQSVFIATSLDGFIARSNGEIDWLLAEDDRSKDYGYKEFISTVDALVMGRITFEKALTFDEWPYSSTRVIVLTGRPIRLPNHLLSSVNVLSGPPQKIVDQLAEEGLHHLYIDGGKTIQRFLNAGLIQEMIITRIPILIGDGIPLFGPLEEDIKLQHISTQTFDNGFVQSHYKVNHNI